VEISKGQQIELEIDRIAFGGSGVGTYRGLVIFVPFSAPGDRLLIEITKKKKNHALGAILEKIKESPHRREAPCEYFGSCGGCDFQHIKYEAQLQYKKEALESLLCKQLKVELPKIEIYGSPTEFNYRNRIQLNQKKGLFGYFGKGGKSFVPIKSCLLANESINSSLKNLESQFKRFEIFWDGQEIHTSPTDFGGSEGSFVQINDRLNLKLITKVLDAIGQSSNAIDSKTEKFIELYSGNGNFTLPILQKFPFKGFSIEFNPKNTERAKQDLKDLNNFDIHTAPAEEFENFHTDETINHLLVDPPRDGLSLKVVTSIKNCKPKNLYYISCHPAALARDLKLILPFYKIESLAAFDMFPQTGHLEVFCHLSLI
jgi:23S rRNA (uracil1939-C5)-methyltransferase